MREEYIEKLSNFIRDTYPIDALSIEPCKRGFFGETWRINSDKDYFLKLDRWDYHMESYKRSLEAVKYLRDSGIDFVPGLIETKKHQLYSEFDGGIVALFDFVKGENREDYPLPRLFEKLSAVYSLNYKGDFLEVESFEAEPLATLERLKNRSGMSEKILATLSENSDIIEIYSAKLLKLSDICKKDKNGFRITHGDAGGNCILTDNSFYIMDWDTVMVAPPERDAWFFICEEKLHTMFEAELIKRGIVEYKLRPERLCYYGYFSLIHYITEYMNSYLYSKNEERKTAMVSGLADYFRHGWIFNQLKVADRLYSELTQQ